MGSYQTEDPRVLEVLRRRPPSGGHGAGQGVPGVAEFPAEWSKMVLLERITEATSEPDHSLTVGSSTASFRDFDGVWIGALVRTRAGQPPRLVTAFPVVDGKLVRANAADPQPFLLNRTVETALDELRAIAAQDDVLNDQLWAGRALLKAGEPYEAAVWVVEMCADTGCVLSEPVYSNLLLMADDGYFDTVYGPGFRKVITRLWKSHHPATWAPA